MSSRCVWKKEISQVNVAGSGQDFDFKPASGDSKNRSGEENALKT